MEVPAFLLTPSAILTGLFGLTFLLVGLSLLTLRGTPAAEERYHTPARFFLVALRLAIGWHCLVEGLEKLHKADWSSEPYLREAIGPLAPMYRNLAGDSVVAKLTTTQENHLPEALAIEWENYLDAFLHHYQITGEQAKKVDDVYRAQVGKTVAWLSEAKEEVEIPAPYPPPLKHAWTIRQRLEKYEALKQKFYEAEARLPSSNEVDLKRYKDAKADMNKWRAALKKSLDAQTASMKAAMDATLSEDQKIDKLDPLVRLSPRWWQSLDIADNAVTWGLIGAGLCLLLGLFSRFASFLLGVLIFSFYLAQPALPGWPESPRLEGHYVLINKTLIEAIALFALAFIPTGRWAGLDALFALCCATPEQPKR